MKKLLIPLILIFGPNCNAKTIRYFGSAGKNANPIEFFKKEGLLVSTECSRNCEAITATKNKPITNVNSEVRGNPAAVYCENHGSTSMVLKDEKGNQNSFCKFSDGSMIDAWDLYYHFNPKD
jgi:putative hemolysin